MVSQVVYELFVIKIGNVGCGLVIGGRDLGHSVKDARYPSL